MAKYIFITGGVVSGLGKGIAAASLGRLLKARGLKVALQKFDPYLNIDPGTMNPYQHGEVFVTEDGAETDLDLGHYERFTDEDLTVDSSITSGKVYWSVLSQEREGAFLGGTVQVIPHITGEIKERIYRVGRREEVDVVITEIGGTVGDIESLPYIEAVRQLRYELGANNSLVVHLTLIPYMAASGELKTKPTQHSVKQLLENGLQPDALVLRTEKHLTNDIRRKVALFCNVDVNAVVESIDVPTIYEVPLILHEQHLDDIVCEKLGIKAKEADLSQWKNIVHRYMEPQNGSVTIAMVGKYVDYADSYKSLNEALIHAGITTDTHVKVKYVDSTDIEENGTGCLEGVDAILVPGGFGKRGVEGMIKAIEYARTHKIPFLGICLGMQCAVIEFARHVCGLGSANSTEFDVDTPHPVVALITEWHDRTGKVEHRDEDSDLGGTMRLGRQECPVEADTLAHSIYGDHVAERHRHRYEVNNSYVSQFEEKGMVIAARTPKDHLPEIMEIHNHPFFIGVQFHPEFTSNPREGHPLFTAYVKAAIAERDRKATAEEKAE